MDKDKPRFPKHRSHQWCFALFAAIVSTTVDLTRTLNRRKEVIEE